MPKKMVRENVMTTGEFSRALGVSQNTVIRWCDNKSVRCHRIGKHRSIPTEELDRMQALLDSGAQIDTKPQDSSPKSQASPS